SSGDIAITVQGRFPVRAYEQGRFVQDGSKWANGWHNFIPEDQVPAMKNPSRGFVFSANQHSTPPSYPYYYLGDFEDFRGRHLYERLNAMHQATPDSMKLLQTDNFSQRAHDALPAMMRLINPALLDAEGQKTLGELAAWDFRYDADKVAPTLFEVWLDSCYAKTWDEMAALKAAKKEVLMPKMWRFIALLESDTSSLFFDHPATPVREVARDIVRESFQSMQGFFKQNPQQRVSWGAFRPTTIHHLARIAAFSRTGLQVGGHGSALNAVKADHGPSWRMVVHLGDPIRAWGVYPGGQSGNPSSRYYDNMVDTWAKGAYYDLLRLSAPDENPDGRIIGRQVFSPHN
ncbi:MAG TPA: penicillin acylase family protein, partial [Saprospiraceae bacterium]|nr:penicillin acylase family protein [Saprospiraceae bacterium]